MTHINDSSISMERLDGETILIDFESGKYFSFLGPSADILWLIERQVSKDLWPDVLAQAYPNFHVGPNFWTEVNAFLTELEAEGIVTSGDPSTGPHAALPADHDRSTWQAPTVQINDELSDLLVIDPIHESDDDGWPQAKQG